MPEGPEILITSQYLQTKLKNKIILKFKVLSGRYSHSELKGLDLIKKGIKKELKIKSVNSKGKFLWFELEDKSNKKYYIMNTFGLTGAWGFYKEKNSRILVKVSKPNDDKIYNLYYTDDRNFGTLSITDELKDIEEKLNDLAPDILKSNMTEKEVIDIIDNYIKKIKPNSKKNITELLMDQTKLVSGIGNYLVSEILYDAKINPHRNIDSFDKKEIKNLAKSMRYITKLSYVDNVTGYMGQFKDFMSKHKDRIKTGAFPNYLSDIDPDDQFVFKVYQKDKDPYDNIVKKDSIIKDRTIHWVPKIQK